MSCELLLTDEKDFEFCKGFLTKVLAKNLWFLSELKNKSSWNFWYDMNNWKQWLEKIFLVSVFIYFKKALKSVSTFWGFIKKFNAICQFIFVLKSCGYFQFVFIFPFGRSFAKILLLLFRQIAWSSKNFSLTSEMSQRKKPVKCSRHACLKFPTRQWSTMNDEIHMSYNLNPFMSSLNKFFVLKFSTSAR